MPKLGELRPQVVGLVVRVSDVVCLDYGALPLLMQVVLLENHPPSEFDIFPARVVPQFKVLDIVL